MLIEIHILQNHAPSNLNRDDTGSPKDCIFGGFRRSRISSQCIKRSIRRSSVFEEEIEGMKMGIRTVMLPIIVKDALVKAGIDEKLASIAAKKISEFGKKEKKESSGEEEESTKEKKLTTKQIIFFSPQDIDAVIDVLKEEIKAQKTAENLSKVKTTELQAKIQKKGVRPISPDIALFGRMTTSEAFEDVDASIQVAHAISTNKMEHEFDFFTAVDDKKQKGEDMEEKGASMIGDVEFNSSCYYKYFSLDVDGFLNNMTRNDSDDQKEAKQFLLKTIKAFLKAAIYTTPTGKQNTFAAHQLPDGILVEVRPKKVPVSYANAFLKPCMPLKDQDLMEVSLERFSDHVNLITKKFSLESIVRLWFTTKEKEGNPVVTIENATTCNTIDDLLRQLAKTVESNLS